MAKKFKHNGFSLTEVLMAVGILSMGMMLIATMFPVGIYLTTVATERTMAAIVEDEAFVKMQFYGLAVYPAVTNNSFDYEGISKPINPIEFSYPSVDPATVNCQYYWSALCRRTDPLDNTKYQVTVFVARKTNPALMYPDPSNFANSIGRPRLINIVVSAGPASNELTISNAAYARYVNPPAAVLDDATGEIYRVIDRKEVAGSPVVTIDRDWEGAAPNSIWLIPPPQGGGKNAGIEVLQRSPMGF